MAKKSPVTRPEKEYAKVAYRGILDEFRVYTTKDGVKYVVLPSGKRGYVVPRTDGTYMLTE